MEFIENVRENWTKIMISTDDCNVINYDTKLDKNSPTYSLKNENESFMDWLNRDPKKIELVDVPRTKILCKYSTKENVNMELSKIVDKDITVVDFKLRMQDYVSVYFQDELDNENYFIDLEFLDEEIDKTKFK